MSDQWIKRLGTKESGFRYAHADGEAVREPRELERIESLRIPPAWRDVHIAARAGSTVQAWGFDSKGRKQYRYHERAVARREMRKHHRVRRLARDLPTIRRRLRADSRRPGMPRERVAAGIVELISEVFIRPGSEKSVRENRTFGLTTLRKSHVTIEDGVATLRYTGKGRVKQRQTVSNPSLVRFLKALRRSPGPRLFRYRGDDGAWCDISARDVNTYLRDLVGVPYTCKDFRTWGGTLRAAVVLSEIGADGAGKSEVQRMRDALMAVRLVAAELGNTPAICRQSYVHPIVLARYVEAGETIAPMLRRIPEKRPTLEHRPEERALIRFLDRHFPERRRRKRAA
ncbi:MAG TPA: hypothetical protein VKA84_29210 [Gemmatimonadaceae bacterium]|nr:hypothetical protein [Gemmatimonadaceae bacterium]